MQRPPHVPDCRTPDEYTSDADGKLYWFWHERPDSGSAQWMSSEGKLLTPG